MLGDRHPATRAFSNVDLYLMWWNANLQSPQYTRFKESSEKIILHKNEMIRKAQLDMEITTLPVESRFA